MEAISKFRLDPKEPTNVDAGSDLLAEDNKSLASLPGIRLCAQYQCDLGYLIVTDEDCPYEEALHITLLSHDYKRVDSLSLGHIYASGIFKQTTSELPSTLEFSFFGGDHWRLTFEDPPKPWPIRLMVPGIMRRWRRRFKKHHIHLVRLDGKTQSR